MTFRHVIESVGGLGATEKRATDFAKPVLHIGRGSAADIVLESRLVALHHAVLRATGDGFSIEDLGSPGGLRVNGRSVLQARLEAGDVVKLGDVTVRVIRDGETWGFLERRREQAESSTPVGASATLRLLDLAHHLPPLSRLSILAALLGGGIFLLVPLAGGASRTWSSGPLTDHHRLLAANCENCHGAAFAGVADAPCLSCHRMNDHAAPRALTPGCVDCHQEHGGDERLLPRASVLCTSCHARSGDAGTRPIVTSFADHPEFSVPVSGASREITKLRFKHKVHVTALTPENGLPEASCVSCHEETADLAGLRPIAFQPHCQRCHALEFDSRLEGDEVPHGSPELALSHVTAAIARLELQPNAALVVEAAAGPTLLERVATGVQDGEDSLLEEDGVCTKCHTVTAAAPGKGRSRFAIAPPKPRAPWMPTSFEHGTHRGTACLTCHAGAPTSTKATDVLLPSIQVCRQCHADPGAGAGTIDTPCLDCHRFHATRARNE